MKRLRAGGLASLTAASAALLCFVLGVFVVFVGGVAPATAGLGAYLSVDAPKKTLSN